MFAKRHRSLSLSKGLIRKDLSLRRAQRAGVVRSLRELPSYFVTRGIFCELEIDFGALRGFAKGLPRRGGRRKRQQSGTNDGSGLFLEQAWRSGTASETCSG